METVLIELRRSVFPYRLSYVLFVDSFPQDTWPCPSIRNFISLRKARRSKACISSIGFIRNPEYHGPFS